MHRRCKRDFLPHGIDNSFEINFAHSHAPLRQVRHSAARTIRGTALSTDRHASLLFEGSLAVASMAKKGRNRERPDRTFAKPVAPMTRGRRPLAQLARCVLDSATNQEG
jgi:hypothetical protein